MRLPILTYHQLTETPSAVSVAPAAFRRHLARLAAAGYRVVPLGEALTVLAAEPDGDPKLAVVTFDDGYQSVCDEAWPALAAYGWRATVFPVSDYVGRGNDWPRQPLLAPPAPLMGWAALRALADAGWEIGGHTRTHPDLCSLGDAALADELRGSKAALEERLGRPVATFAYPYGRYDARVRAAVRAVHAAACTTRMAVAGPRSDRWALERLDAYYFQGSVLPHVLATPLTPPYVAAVRALRGGRSGLRRVRAAWPLEGSAAL